MTNTSACIHALVQLDERIAFIGAASIIIVDAKSGDIVAATASTNSNKQKEQAANHPLAQWFPPDLGIPQPKQPKKQTDEENKQADQEIKLLRPRIRAAAWHNPSNSLAIIDAAKNLRILKHSADGFVLFNTRQVIKGASAILFDQDGKNVLVGDKFGDVYRFQVDNPDMRPQLLLGHVSMLLDMAWSNDHKYIITADRDEKIRVSKYPHSYEIERFCLGHEQLVSRLIVLPGEPDRVVSGGGDPFIILWDYLNGNPIFRLSFSDEFENQDLQNLAVLSMRYCPQINLIALVFENHNRVYLIDIDRKNDKLSIKQTIQTPHTPSDILFVTDSNNAVRLWISFAQLPENASQSIPHAGISELTENSEFSEIDCEHVLVKNINGLEIESEDIVDVNAPGTGGLFELHKLRKGSHNSHYHDKKRQQKNARDALESGRSTKRACTESSKTQE